MWKSCDLNCRVKNRSCPHVIFRNCFCFLSFFFEILWFRWPWFLAFLVLLKWPLKLLQVIPCLFYHFLIQPFLNICILVTILRKSVFGRWFYIYFGIDFVHISLYWFYDFCSKLLPVPQTCIVCYGELLTLEDITWKHVRQIHCYSQSATANEITTWVCVCIKSPRQFNRFIASVPKYINHCLPNLNICTFFT